MVLTVKDYKKILYLVDLIHSVPDKSEMFRKVCEELQQLIGFSKAVFVPYDFKTGKFPSFFDEAELFNHSDRTMFLYYEHYVHLDPFITSGSFNNVNTVAQNTDIVAAHSLLNSEFATDFLLHKAGIFHIIAASIASEGDKVGVCAFQREKKDKPFDMRAKEITHIILPHIARVFRNHALKRERKRGTGPEGVIAIGQDGKPFYINDAAKQILSTLQMNCIPNMRTDDKPTFAKKNAEMYRIRTEHADGKGRSKLILFERYPPKHKLYTKLSNFNLSRREEEISALVLQGYSNKQIAEHLFICEQTVKDHLHNIFEKMKIKRRTALAAKILGFSKAQDINDRGKLV